ncbi:MAG: 4-hydroxy-tetrahydrodipicolinate synthase [Gammaproteobacteria bacterium]
MFRGSIVALVSPMSADRGLDFAALERLLEFHIAAGTAGIVIAGTTGESPTIDPGELEELVAAAVAMADGRVPIIGGSGSNDTRRAEALTRRVARAGAKASLVVTPYYNKPSQAGLSAHYRAVAEAAELPLLLYNVPGRTACDLLPETAAALAEVENICGLKEAVPDPQRLQRLRELCPPDFCLLSGDDPSARGFMLGGGQGVVSVTANVAPAAMAALSLAALGGRADEAAAIDQPLRGLHRALFLEGNPVPVKWALAAMGLIGPTLRLPLTELSDGHRPALAAALAEAGIEIKGGHQ